MTCFVRSHERGRQVATTLNATAVPSKLRVLNCLLFGAAVWHGIAQEQTNLPSYRLPDVIVTARREAAFPLGSTSPRLGSIDETHAADCAALLTEIPGAAVVRNGPQTGIVQLRGLSGDRVRVLVDGAAITPACPNHMDPPLHYAAPSAVESLMVLAGITPVSAGGDSLAGTVLVDSASPRLSTNDALSGFGEVTTSFRSSDDGWTVGGSAGAASREFGILYQGSWQRGDDLRFPGGRVRDTGYDTQRHRALAAVTNRAGLWTADAGVSRSRDTGTPALPMDMIKDDACRVGLSHHSEHEFGFVEGRFYHHEIEHLMDNYSLRPPGAMRMFSPATSDDSGLNLGVSLPQEVHTFRVGSGFHLNQFDAFQQNAMTSARQDTLNDAHRLRVGTFAEWQADWSSHWTTVLGMRNDTVMSDASDVGQFFPPGAADAAAFNAQNHDFTDANFDLTAAVRFTPNKWSAYELGFARKNRAPSVLERYLWTPLSASAGQADGRTYLGNLHLDSEMSHQVAFTADWHGHRWELKVTPFYNFVTDYIQGTPIARLDASGNNVLQFDNVGRADLYGADGSASFALTTNLIFSATASYVRGINRDNGDNLYRIAPLRGSLAMEHKLVGWQNRIEVVLVDRQDKTSAYNGEKPTPGYVLLNLRTGYQFNRHLRVDVGLENVFDCKYADHLGGINRVAGSDVALGAHIPGAGRFVYVSAGLQF